ncbi:hypothetical protein L2E82_32514 [Cichorium intybus]|uniref:Uncharacterized protein n=1 Tax=Cichorium intybus TaxID=13427 RepID=A0ACB9BI51_CICIN|nr:hypothetical protein L2E82_32514 [Cichorium intybus]
MHSVLSLEFITPPLLTSLHGGRSCSHRLKRRLHKGDRRAKTDSRHTRLVGFISARDKLDLARSNLPEKVPCNTLPF